MSQAPQDNSGQTTFLFIGLFLLIFIAVPALYVANAEAVNGFFLKVAKLQLRLFIPFSEEAQKAWVHITSQDASTLTWDKMSAILNYTGKWARWPLALILFICGGLSIVMSTSSKLTRRFNMKTLLINNAEVFPCLAPIVGKGEFLISQESYDSGLWKIAQTPLQFCVHNGLLSDNDGNKLTCNDLLNNGVARQDAEAYGNLFFNEKAAHEIFIKQLGEKVTYSNRNHTLSELAPLRKALATAFITYASGDKQECMILLDALSISYNETEGAATCKVLEKTDYQEAIEKNLIKYAPAILNSKFVERHASYELTWFMALLNKARQKGVLATSQFLFLRACDRPLWYVLNQCGGRASWAEGAAAWAHYMAEEKRNRRLDAPHVHEAVVSMKTALDAQGWLYTTGAPSQKTDTPPPPPQEAYSAEADAELAAELF